MSRTPSGFYSLKCPFCTDYKKRAGLTLAHNSIGFNCFNCGEATRYDSGQCHIPNKLRTLFTHLGGSEETLQDIRLKLLTEDSPDTITVESLSAITRPTRLAVPRGFQTMYAGLTSANNESIRCASYILDKRKLAVDPESVFVYTAPPGDEKMDIWRDRLIFPIVMWNHIVGFSGRLCRPQRNKGEPKYLTQGPKSNMIFNYDVGMSRYDRPLLVMEGPLCALRVDGVAVLSNRMSANQIHWLNQIDRPKVVIPDMNKSGTQLVEQAVELGWGVSLPEFGACKDVDEAVCQYGLLYTVYQVLKTITYGETALLKAAGVLTK